jgi:nicotinamide mononucleotide (NMN) deamidase PncC
METKAARLTALLRNRRIYRVTIETPAGGTLREKVLEDPEGIEASAEGNTVTFKAKDKAVSFNVASGAEILTNHARNAFVIVTLAGNGGLQIMCRD